MTKAPRAGPLVRHVWSVLSELHSGPSGADEDCELRWGSHVPPVCPLELRARREPGPGPNPAECTYSQPALPHPCSP